jgi:sugar/nucleoside kinase (ribokinase family)
MDKIDVLVIGRSCVDFIAVVEQFPREDTKVPLVYRMVEGGGQGGTASCCIARLGGKSAYYGHLGDDDEGRFCLKRLKDFQVDTRFVEFVQHGKTPVAYILITHGSGNRTIIYERNTLPQLKLDRLAQILTNPVTVILLDPEVTYLAQGIKKLVAEGIKIIYDCERWHDNMPDMMAAADYFIPSYEFLQARELIFDDLSFDQKMFRLAEMINGCLVVTHGAHGAYYLHKEHVIHVPAPAVSVKDTIGAGDNFHAAFSMAVSLGYDLSASVKFSVAVASLSCREYGGRQGIPSFAEANSLARTLDERVAAITKSR